MLLTKLYLAPILKEALELLKTTSISNAFKACGIFTWNVDNIDFSKGLDKKTVNDQNERRDERDYLTYNDFRAIVGPEEFQQIKTGKRNENISNPDEDFQLLLKIFRKFTIHVRNDEGKVSLDKINDSVVRVELEDVVIQMNLDTKSF